MTLFTQSVTRTSLACTTRRSALTRRCPEFSTGASKLTSFAPKFLIPTPPRARRVAIAFFPSFARWSIPNTARTTAFKLRAREALSLSSLNGKGGFLHAGLDIVVGCPSLRLGERGIRTALRLLVCLPAQRVHRSWSQGRRDETSRSDRVCFEHTQARRSFGCALFVAKTTYGGADGNGGSYHHARMHCITMNASARGCSSSGLCPGDCAHPLASEVM